MYKLFAHLASNYNFSHEAMLSMSLKLLLEYYKNSFDLPYLIKESINKVVEKSHNHLFSDWQSCD